MNGRLFHLAGIFSASAALLVLPVVSSAVDFPEVAKPMLFEAQAQDCINSDGNPRECTDSEDYAICLTNVDDALDQCLDANAGRGLIKRLDRVSCRVLAAIDALGCAIQYLADVLGPSE